MASVYYRNSARELKRLEAMTRGPAVSRLTELITGLTTVRTFKAESYVLNQCNLSLADNLKAFQSQKILELWLIMHQTSIGVGVVVGVGFSIVALHTYRGRRFGFSSDSDYAAAGYDNDGISPASAGLVLLYALQISMFLTMLTMMLANVEGMLTGVERLHEFAQLPSEESEAAAERDIGVLVPLL